MHSTSKVSFPFHLLTAGLFQEPFFFYLQHISLLLNQRVCHTCLLRFAAAGMSWKISSYRTMRIDIKRRCNTFESVAASSEFFTEVMTALLARVERVSSSPVYVNSHCTILKEQNFHDRSGIRYVSIATWYGKLVDSTAHKFVEYRKKRNSWINQLSRNHATFFVAVWGSLPDRAQDLSKLRWCTSEKFRQATLKKT